MDKAKAAVHDFLSKAGHHDTTVHEKVAPAVTHETIEKRRHEEIQPAIEKEIHQDHYHTSVQPVLDRRVVPETHTHHMAPVEVREYDHGNNRDITERLKQEQAQFHDTRIEGKTVETRSTAPAVAGEHIHHHVHETIQPVVEREVIQPQVIHTTVPIHEVHHNAAQHHSTSALPAVSMTDFKKQGGVLTGREERYDGFEGEPKAIGSNLGSNTTGLTGTTGMTGSTHSHNPLSSHHNTTGMTGSTANGGTHKPSMMDKINPFKDTDHDGKKGFME